MESYTYATIYSSYFFLLIATVLGILKYKSLKNEENWYVYYLLYTLIIEASVNISIEFFETSGTGTIYKFYIGGVFSILANLYMTKLEMGKTWAVCLSSVGLLYLAIYTFLENHNDDYIKVISNIIIFALAGITLLKEIKKPDLDNRFLWTDALIFLYYTVSAFIFILHNELGNMDSDLAFFVWGINNILTCVLYSSFIYTFLKLKK